MYNPSLSDCSSLTEDLDCTQAPDLSPVKRDPALLRERLEACGSRKRQGRKKRQKALNGGSTQSGVIVLRNCVEYNYFLY